MNPSETVKNWAQNAKQFYYDVRNEMKKVSWPGRQEVIGTTVVVIVSVFFWRWDWTGCSGISMSPEVHS
jgi:preprotein translocase subunit SecE